jgi:prepilin-type processing-associated H-X9-DG protein
MTAAILGVGTAVPARSIAQSAALEMARFISTPGEEQERLLPVLYRRTNVKRRGSVLLEDGENGDVSRAQSFFSPASGPRDQGPGTGARLDRYAREAPVLGAVAGKAAMAEARVRAEEITHLVTVSCTGFMAPGLDAILIRELGLSRQVQRTHVGFMGCHGAINGLRVAKAFVDADPRARVLVVAVELCSLHFHYGTHPERMVANALFADGAAAVVVGDSNDASVPRLAGFGSCIIPESEDAMTWRIGDHGFEMTLSARVPDLLREQLRGWVDSWLAGLGLDRTQVGAWAIHPGGPRILSTVAQTLLLPEGAIETSSAVLSERGNMSSPTVLFILRELMRQGKLRPYVALGFGPGLVAEGMVVH